MKNILKKLIIILVIVAVALIATIVVLQNGESTNNKNNNSNIIDTDTDVNESNKDEDEKEEAPVIILSEEMKKEETESIFYAMKQHINKYYNAIEKQDSNQVYYLLSEQYIAEKNVNTSNVISVVGKLGNGFQDFRVRKVYYRQLDLTGKFEYYILGDILGEKYISTDSVYIIVNVDGQNNTFSITPTNINIVNDTQYLQQLTEIRHNTNNEIIKNDYNSYSSKSLQTKDILQFYLGDYATMALYYPNIAYNLLDEEYRNKRFGSIEEYKNHIKLNKLTFQSIIPIKYGFKQKGEKRQYTVIDNYNNTYVIEIGDAMEYCIISDMYTVNMDSIVEKYDNGSNEAKVKINIQKIVEALNNKDYKYLYGKLSEDFKYNKYPSIENLQNDIVTNGSHIVVFNDYKEDGDNYIYDIELRGQTVSTGNLKMRITMQLKEERDFRFEFELIKEQENS